MDRIRIKKTHNNNNSEVGIYQLFLTIYWGNLQKLKKIKNTNISMNTKKNLTHNLSNALVICRNKFNHNLDLKNFAQ